jgi:Tol biopolymer transport system component
MPSHCIGRIVRAVVALAVLLMLVAGCGKGEPSATPVAPTDSANLVPPTETPAPTHTATPMPPTPSATAATGEGAELEGQALYLGQTPPGPSVEVFAPGIVSIEDGKEYKITISPDLQEIFFTRRTPNGRNDRIWYTRLENGALTTPQLAPFAYDSLESDACFTPDGRRLYFNSRRPLPGEETLSERQNVWFVDRTEEGWSEPQFLGPPLNDYRPVYFSIADDGTLYFTRSSPREIWYAELQDGEYGEAQRLPDEVNALRDIAHPAVAPDESYIVVDSVYFEGERLAGGLYISFRKPDGSWTEMVSMHEALNASETDIYASARISPDGKYLFFESYLRETDQADICWVSTEVIEELRSEMLKDETSLPHREGGQIAFVSTRDGNGEIYVMNADGSNPQRLTNWQQWDGYPAWSPDGTQIAFYSYLSSKDWVIKVMNSDGGNVRQLTDNGICDGAPHWSPDGTKIAYSSAADCTAEHREIYVMNTDGTGQRNMTNHDADEASSSWSPDSQQIVFASDRDGDYDIYIMNADSGDVRQLTENGAEDLMPAWSPWGAQIAFVSDRDGNDEIYLMDVGGDHVRRLTTSPTVDWFPTWSPDGSQLLFNSKRDGNLEIYVMDVDGSNVHRLTNDPADDFNAVWQPSPAMAGKTSTWIRTYQGDPRWAALDALQTGDGGYLLVGATNYSHQNTPQEDVYLVKTDAVGEIQWAEAYGGDDFDRGKAVVETDDGGFVILGESASFGAGDWDMFLLRVDRDGNELWSRTFGGPGKERGNAILRTSDGGYIFTGQTPSFGAGDEDLYLVSTDDQGNEVWSRTYGGERDEEGYAIQETADGGFLILAEVSQGETVYFEENPDVMLLRTDAAGDELWSRVWEEEDVEGGFVLLPTSDGHYLLAGISGPAGNQTDIDFLFIKIDADGNPIWNKPLGDEDAVDYGTDAIELPDGGYLLIGMFSDGGRGAIPLIKTDTDGEIVWRRNLVEGRGNKAGMKILPAPDRGYLIVGITTEFGRGFEAILIKTDSEGNLVEQ